MQHACRRFVVPSSIAFLLALALTSCTDHLGPEEDNTPGDTARGPGSSLVYETATLGTLGGESGFARGINNRNQVVGAAENGEGELRAFVWRGGHMEELEGLGGSFSGAYAISNSGLIAGEAETADGDLRAVLWRDGQPVDLGTLGGDWSTARDVNARGQVVGFSANADGEVRPFLWWRGTMEELPLPPAEELVFASAEGINDRGQIVGTRAGFFGHAFQDALFWSTPRDVRFLESPCHEYAAFDLNARGQIVGGGLGCPLAPTEVAPLIWQRATEESEHLEPLGGLQEVGPPSFSQNVGSASAINGRGQVAGISDAAEDVDVRDMRATLWDREEPIDLSGPVEEFSVSVSDINDRSVVAGRLEGLPALFVPGSEPGLVPGHAPAARVPAAPRAPGERVLPGVGLREALVGTRSGATWARQLCEGKPRLMPSPTVAEVLAGCP